MNRVRTARFFLFVATLFGACAREVVPSASDGGTATCTDGATPPATLFARCTSDRECGSSSFCDVRYPGGICTTRCADSCSCGPNGFCFGDECRPRCRSGSLDCDQYGAACDDPFCLPSCFAVTGAPAAAPACIPGTMCDPVRVECVRMPSVGAEDGSPCSTGRDCRSGACFSETFGGAPTGNVNGMCFSNARREAPDSFVHGMPLPTGNCPPGTAQLIYAATLPEGLWTECYPECSATRPCRSGYYCDQDQSGTGVGFADGICRPSNCTRVGMGCPPGFHCVASPGGGLCARDG